MEKHPFYVKTHWSKAQNMKKSCFKWENVIWVIFSIFPLIFSKNVLNLCRKARWEAPFNGRICFVYKFNNFFPKISCISNLSFWKNILNINLNPSALKLLKPLWAQKSFIWCYCGRIMGKNYTCQGFNYFLLHGYI
jgi:hypothetical protein